ncbi:phage tail tape measure protein [uncultured Draconibacterium sp.]|uniref:phage tail tape measure protein n=1 Tax=uncultured Draconibacterium sp. TaxID=1573823 RepID=UPI00326183D9
MSTKVFKYILNFQADAQKFGKDIGGVKGMLKGAAVAAGALFAADKILDAAKAVGEYSLEISKVRSEVEKFTGLSGAQADAMAGGAEAIKQAYGQEVSEVIKASNVLMRQFGETSQSSFDILNAGLAGVANANGDFLHQIQEYSTHFREAGLDAGQMYAIIEHGNKTGVFDDKAADAIKEGSIRLREMTTSTQDALKAIGLSSTQIQQEISSGNKSMFEVMRLVSKQLQTLPQQSPAVGAALADIFGGPGEDGIEFIRTLAEIDTSMEGMLGNLTDAQKAQMAFTEELQEFHTIGAQVFGGTGTLVTKVKTLFMGFVNDAIRGAVQVINYFIDLYNESMVFRGAIEYIKFSVQNVFKAIGFVFKQFWNNLKSTGKLIKAVFTGNFKAIPDIIKQNFNNTIDNAQGFGQDMADRFKQGVENVLNPRKKIELVTLSTDAEPAGVEDGANYAKGFTSGYKGHAVVDTPELMQPSRGGEQVSVSLGKDELKAFDAAKTQLADMDDFIQKNKASVDEMTQSWMSFGETMHRIAEEREVLQGGLSQLEIAGLALGDSFMQMAKSGEVSLENLGSAIFSTVTDSIRAYIAEGVAGSVAKTLSFLPFPANVIMAGVAATAATALFNSVIPKFADGGIAYGPTVGMIGEYPGARSNPEVIAPLDKLKGMLAGSGGGRDRLVIPTTRIRKGDIYISYKEAEKELTNRT